MRSNGRRTWSSVSSPELAIASVLLAIAAAAWVSTILRMAGMDAGPWSYPTDLELFITTWVVMMAAMMLPSILPAVLASAREIRDQRRRLRSAVALSGAFAGGYLAVWSVAGLIPYALLSAVSAFDGGLLMGGAGRLVAAGVLLAAAAYQLAPSRQDCLRRLCAARPPGRHDGLGALRAGLQAGGWCLACCWALMASLLALGVMSLTWMAVIWALVMAERLLPSRRVVTVVVACILGALAIAVLLGAPMPAHTGASM